MNPRLKTALAMLLPALCLVGLFWKVWPTLGTRFAGIEYVDHYGTQWFYWFTEQAVLGEESAVHTDLMFFPFGKDIYGQPDGDSPKKPIIRGAVPEGGLSKDPDVLRRPRTGPTGRL